MFVATYIRNKVTRVAQVKGFFYSLKNIADFPRVGNESANCLVSGVSQRVGSPFFISAELNRF